MKPVILSVMSMIIGYMWTGKLNRKILESLFVFIAKYLVKPPH
ncbi:hypothetical protein THIOSC15_1330002 [uncultured Thiomicrorhabdus sp.]